MLPDTVSVKKRLLRDEEAVMSIVRSDAADVLLRSADELGDIVAAEGGGLGGARTGEGAKMSLRDLIAPERDSPTAGGRDVRVGRCAPVCSSSIAFDFCFMPSEWQKAERDVACDCGPRSGGVKGRRRPLEDGDGLSKDEKDDLGGDEMDVEADAGDSME